MTGNGTLTGNDTSTGTWSDVTFNFTLEGVKGVRVEQGYGGVGLLSETSTHSTTLQLQNLQKEHIVDQELF